MPYLMDIYALAPERSAASVQRFLARFLPDRRRAADDYWVQLGGVNPASTFDTPEEMVQFCEAHPEAEARAYWNSRVAGDPHSAHVFFLPAGGLVLGLSVAAENEPAWHRWLDELMAFAGLTTDTGPASARPKTPWRSSSRWHKRHAEPGGNSGHDAR
jgi:hypothetical protein